MLPAPALAQTALDRVDPSRVEERAQPTETDAAPETPPPTQAAATPAVGGNAIRVGAIQLQGLTEMSRAAFADIIERYIGRTLQPTELAELTDTLAKRARTRLPFATARIERQAMVGGVLTVTIDEGRIDEVRVEGVRNRAIDAALAPLANGAPVRLDALERRLLLAGDIDGVTIGKSRVVREDDRNVLVVTADFQHVTAQLTLDNDSTKPLGPLELFGTLQVNGLVADDDSLQFFALDTVPHFSELAFARIRYGKRIAPNGAELAISASYSHSAPGAYLERFDIKGESWFASVSALQPLFRRKAASLWLEGSLGYRAVDQWRADRLIRQDRMTVARAGIYGYGSVLGGALRISSTLSQGLALFGATELGDPLASRLDADGTFTVVNMFADWTHALAGPVGIKLAVRSQLASQPLLIAEEVGLGGAAFIRGYDYSERSGDRGTMASGELRYDWGGTFGPARDAQLYAFVDGGRVDNLRGGFGSGALFSTGGGVRADVDPRTDAALEVALPLSGARYDTGNGEPKLRVSLTRYF